MSLGIKYVADLKHVREVSLLGTADLAFWEDRLRGEGLAPAALPQRVADRLIWLGY